MMQPSANDLLPPLQTTNNLNPTGQPNSDMMVVYIDQTVTPPTTVAFPVFLEKRQKRFLIVSCFFLSLFFFMLISSLTLYIVFIFLFNFSADPEKMTDERAKSTYTHLYGWPLWILVISLTFFLLSLIIFVHRYKAYAAIVRRRMIFYNAHARGINANLPDESTQSITTEKPTDPSTIVLSAPMKSQPMPPQRVEMQNMSSVYQNPNVVSSEEPAVEYIHNPNVLQ